MNASTSTLLRALSGLSCAALLLTIVQACSGDETSTPTPPAGPASIEITGIALGHGFVGGGGASSILSCDNKIGVNVQLTNWTLLGPGRCSGALQCGQLRVTLIDQSPQAEGAPEVLQVIAAGNGVSLDGSLATPPVHVGEYAVRAELIDDAGHPYIELDGGNGTAQQDFSITAIEGCAANGGSGNQTAGTSGVGGSAGTAGGAGHGGTAGIGGAAETAGNAGVSGHGGTAGIGGAAETGGSVGVAGLGGTAGISGTPGVGGSEVAGTAGTIAGAAGTIAGTGGGN